MATVKLKFRPSTVEGREGSIYFQVIHKRSTRMLLTCYRIYPSDWDKLTSSLLINSKSDRHSQLTAIRDSLKCDIERFDRIILKFDKERTDYTSENVIDEFNRKTSTNSLFNIMQKAVITLQNNGKERTAETYLATYKSFKNFREGLDICIDSLTSKLMEKYQGWLQKRGVSLNTISFYIRIIRALYNRALEEELTINRHPFRREYTGVEKTVKRALSLDLIKKIRSLDLSLRPDLQYARDMFILSFMLRGMSFVDMALLKKTDLLDGHIIYRRRKTGQQMCVQWTKDMQNIIDRYPKNKSEYLLPIIKNDNSKLRYVYKNVGEKINHRLKRIAEMVEISMPLTMYVARHSWASIARNQGIPLSVISQGLGHEKESTTMIYLASLDTSMIDKANDLILRLL